MHKVLVVCCIYSNMSSKPNLQMQYSLNVQADAEDEGDILQLQIHWANL